MNEQERCEKGAAGAGLSKEQRMRLCVAAHAAWLACDRPYYEPALDGHKEGMTRTQAFDFWRHSTAREKFGRESFRAMTQADFPAVMAEFNRLAGNVGQANYWAARTMTDPRRQAEAVLRRELGLARATLGNPEAYLAAIVRCKFHGKDLGDLEERQLWTLVFDLRRAAQRKRKAGPQHDAA